jgi:ATPase subunit of ABC transporter with duplicated ATPase domains
LGGYERTNRAEQVLDGLGLGSVEKDKPVAQMSGGQKTRLGLATLLLQEPDILVLDEPTNHLDLDALDWLESFMMSYPRSILIVSHDRAFLDATVSRVLYLDPETRTLLSYTGGYSAFAEARANERARLVETWQHQQDYVVRVQRDISRMKSEARSIEMSTTARQPSLRKLARKKATVAKSREKKLERYLASARRHLADARCWKWRTSRSRIQSSPRYSNTSASTCGTASGWRSSAPTEPARPRCSDSWKAN